MLFLTLQQPPDPEIVAAAAVAAAAVLKTAAVTASPFSDPYVIAMIGTQVVIVIGAIASAVVLILNRGQMRVMQDQQAVNAAHIMTVRADTEAIKGHVNSEKTAANGRETTLQKENALLREMLTDKKTTAQLLAQAVAVRARPASVVPVVPIAAVVDQVAVQHLEHIDDNTAAAAQALDALAKVTTDKSMS